MGKIASTGGGKEGSSGEEGTEQLKGKTSGVEQGC